VTRDAFDKLLAFLDPDPERAGESYERYRRKLVRFFEWERCECPEDNADEAINRVAKRIGDGEAIQDLNRYIFGVAHLILLEDLKVRKRKQAMREELERLHRSPVRSEDHSAAGCLRSCLEAIAPESRNLILRYYEGEQQRRIRNRAELARELGIPLNALRNRALRLRARLETCIARCVSEGGSRE
jgi:DNA-directed RNA polymerase specialized sigma24 family protein